MRYLGIDFGEARIGIAISDPEGRIAFPKEVIINKSTAKSVQQIKKLAGEEEITSIIIGLPLGMAGEETEESGIVRKFAEKIRNTLSVPVIFENEIFTTRMAEHEGVDKAMADAASAAIILQSYLEKVNKK